jgi:hypothetical protein
VTEQSPPGPPLGPASGPLPGAQTAPASSAESLNERPEVKVAATFAGGLIVATILKRLVR